MYKVLADCSLSQPKKPKPTICVHCSLKKSSGDRRQNRDLVLGSLLLRISSINRRTIIQFSLESNIVNEPYQHSSVVWLLLSVFLTLDGDFCMFEIVRSYNIRIAGYSYCTYSSRETVLRLIYWVVFFYHREFYCIATRHITSSANN